MRYVLTVWEREIRFDVGDAVALPDWARLDGVTSADERGVRFEATYFDTADHRLAAIGATLRRQTGADDGWLLELPAVDSGRHTVRVGVGRAVRTVPHRLRTVVAGVAGGQPLTPVGVVTTHRTVHRLLDGEGEVLAQVADDTVAADALHGDAPPRTWREVSVELLVASPSLRRRLRRRLAEAGAEPTTGCSPLDRLLGGPPAPAAQPTRAKDPVQSLVQHRLATQLDVVVRRDPLAREDLPQGVHTMRVAVRRLRSALATSRPFLDRSVTDPLREELKWLSDALGHARDAEVLRERLDRAIEDLTDTRADIDWHEGLLRSQLWASLAERHEAARHDLDRVLAGERYAALLDQLRHLVGAPPWTERSTQKIGGAYRRRAERDLQRLERRMSVAEAAELTEAERAHVLHEARKATKRARYAFEPLRPVHGRRATTLVKRLKKLQSILGLHQDTVVTRDHLLALSAGDGTLEPAAAMLIGALVERESQHAEDYERAGWSAWRKVQATTPR